MTAWQSLCARLAETHRRDSTGRCADCGQTYPCAVAAMAGPVASDATAPRFRAFAPPRPIPRPAAGS